MTAIWSFGQVLQPPHSHPPYRRLPVQNWKVDRKLTLFSLHFSPHYLYQVSALLELLYKALSWLMRITTLLRRPVFRFWRIHFQSLVSNQERNYNPRAYRRPVSLQSSSAYLIWLHFWIYRYYILETACAVARCEGTALRYASCSLNWEGDFLWASCQDWRS